MNVKGPFAYYDAEKNRVEVELGAYRFWIKFYVQRNGDVELWSILEDSDHLGWSDGALARVLAMHGIDFEDVKAQACHVGVAHFDKVAA